MGTPIHERGYTSVPLPFVLQFPIEPIRNESSYRKRLWRVSIMFYGYNLNQNNNIFCFRNGISCQGFSEA